MKSIAMLGFALAMSPVLASAQTTTQDAASLPKPNFAAMQQVHEQMKSIHERARLAMLGSLTAAHRAAVANIIGQLAIAPNPDRAAAARAIDATLSASERNSVLSTESAAHNQSRSVMEAARTQFESTLTPDQKTAMATRMAERQAQRTQSGTTRPAYTPDAGRTLLELAGGGGEHRGFGPGPGGPPPQ